MVPDGGQKAANGRKNAMIYLFVTFLAFSVLLISKNHRSKNIIWFYFMLVGFILAFAGLALFNAYISSFNEDKLFGSISRLIWALDYYMKLDISKGYRLMNVGTSLYIFGAVCFPLSYINKSGVRPWGFFAAAGIPLMTVIIYDPSVINLVYDYNGTPAYLLVNKQASALYQVLNILFNVAIKGSLVVSIGLVVYVYRQIIPIMQKKFMYMIFGIVPIHILFMVLFYWFPNHKIFYRRLYLLSSISAPYNEFLYGFITYFGIFSIAVLVYAMWRYNIFEISVRKNKVNFQKQMDLAHVGLKVFSHSIKNQLIAIKLLSEQMAAAKDDNRRAELAQEIVKICNGSIEKMGASFKETGVVRLKYENVSINELMERIISKQAKVNARVCLKYECRNEIYLLLDPKQFEKVVDNLIINAVEACSRQKKPVIEVTVEERDSYGVIVIADNGSGIDSKHANKVFEPFFSTKPMSSNWGIGLSYCQKVIEAFGGAIHLESKEYEGTKAYIFIPMNRG